MCRRYCYSIRGLTTAGLLMLKSFLVGTVIGAVLALAPAYNYGRGAPLFSDPFEARSVGTIVGDTARNVADDVKKGIRELAK